MTDLPPRSPIPEPPGDEDDLLASLYLDGEATAEERARVEADPSLMARVEEFRSLAAQVGAVTVPPGLARSQIAAALDAFDAGSFGRDAPVDAPAETAATNVSSLTDRRRQGGLPSWLGAAAVMTLVIGGLGFAATRGSSGDDEAASVETSLSASANSMEADGDDADAAGAADAEMSAAESDAMEEDAATDSAMDDDAMADDGDTTESEEADEEFEEPAEDSEVERLSDEQVKAFWADNGPVDLSDIEATTAAEYYEQLLDFPLQPIVDSPCADSPLVAGLFGVDSFLPVVFDGQPSSLVVQEGAPATAVIVGPTCEIEQA